MLRRVLRSPEKRRITTRRSDNKKLRTSGNKSRELYKVPKGEDNPVWKIHNTKTTNPRISTRKGLQIQVKKCLTTRGLEKTTRRPALLKIIQLRKRLKMFQRGVILAIAAQIPLTTIDYYQQLAISKWTKCEIVMISRDLKTLKNIN